MELTPQTLHAVEFREARRGGYNTRDVDDFIERIAASVSHLNERVREAHARADAAEARLPELQHELEDLRRRPPAAPEVSETDETLRRTLVLAQRTADATIKEAKEEANRVLSEAREEAARTRAEAEAEARRGAEAARTNAQQEVETLLADRDKLHNDLELLTKRMDDQRSQLQSGVSEMQRLLDDPAALKPLPAVKLSDIEAPTPTPTPTPTPARPPLESRVPQQALTDATIVESEGPNGRAPVEVGSPFGGGAGAAGGQVASLQEQPAPPEVGPPTQPMPFAVTGDGRAPWQPSELRVPDDEPLGPAPEPPQIGNGGLPPAPVNRDPANRPSDWGQAVFDPDKAEGDANRFGRRR